MKARTSTHGKYYYRVLYPSSKAIKGDTSDGPIGEQRADRDGLSGDRALGLRPKGGSLVEKDRWTEFNRVAFGLSSNRLGIADVGIIGIGIIG
jgi:hypothetical protein